MKTSLPISFTCWTQFYESCKEHIENIEDKPNDYKIRFDYISARSINNEFNCTLGELRANVFRETYRPTRDEIRKSINKYTMCEVDPAAISIDELLFRMTAIIPIK